MCIRDRKCVLRKLRQSQRYSGYFWVPPRMNKVGKPKVVLSDHGPQFISGKWQQTLGWEGIITKHTAVYHPQSNQAERVMREIGRIFRAYCHAKHSEWPMFVSRIEDWLNCTPPVSYTHLDVYKRQE